MRKRRAIIHFGVAKTGTTSIQSMLEENRKPLIGMGFAYPEAPGSRTHGLLATHASGRLHAPGTREFPARLDAELRALPRDVHTVIFSNEHLSKKIATEADGRRLRALLDPYFDEYLVFAYLRRQDEMAVSGYSTMLRSGRDRGTILSLRDKTRDAYDYWAKLSRWAALFGRAAVQPRLFERASFVGGDLLVDFRAACGLPDLPNASPPQRNPSLGAAAQAFLLRYNALRGDAPGEEQDKIPHAMRTVLNARFSGRGMRPARAEAEAFLGHFRESNERVRAEFFPARERLFTEDFSRYPEVADRPPAEAEVLAVALAVLRETGPDDGKAGRLFARAQQRLAEGRAEEALRQAGRVLDAQPTHRGALGLVVRMADGRPGRREALELLRRAQAVAPGLPDWAALAAQLGETLPAPGGRGPAGRGAKREGRERRERRRDRQGGAAARAGDAGRKKRSERADRA